MYVKYTSDVNLPNHTFVSEYATASFSDMAPPKNIVWYDIVYWAYTFKNVMYLTAPHWITVVMSWYEICDIFTFSLNNQPIIESGVCECDAMLWILHGI